MLRGMVLENFVQFKDRYVFDFSKDKHGPSVFVGASSTGKTTVLELIRRCMDRRLNSSLTNRYSAKEIAYVFCEFYDEKEKYGPIVISGMIVEKKQESCSYIKENNKNKVEQTVEGDIGEEVEEEEEMENIEDDEEDKEWVKIVKEDKTDTIFHKVVMYFNRGKIQFCSKTYLLKSGGIIVDMKRNVRLDQDLLDGILAEGGREFLIEDNDKQPKENYHICKGIENLFNKAFAEKVSAQIRHKQNENRTYNRYPKVWKELQEGFIGLLSLRGMGTFQWTKSRLIDEKYKLKNYEGTCAQAEIITQLLGHTIINEVKEQQIFNFLTGGSKFDFKEKPNSEIVVQHSEREFPLLKTSVGIIEAKQFSLLMAHTKLQTICLEEPDRGMHPQMIERMKEVLHRKSRNKSIIVVTHSPYLLDPMSLRNTFFFSRKNDVAFVVNIYDKLKSNKYFKIVKLEDMKAILFSSKVLFVEGTTDKMVLEAIFRHLIKQSSRSYEEIWPILSHEICFMGRKELRENVSEFCSLLNIKFSLVLDRDAFIETKKSEESTTLVQKIEPVSSIYNKFNGGLVSEFLEDPNGFDAFSTDLEKSKKTFIWKDGELEDFLLSMSEKRSDILEILKPSAIFAKAEDKEDYNKLKAISTNSLKDLSREKLDALAETITHFPETKRLFSFLKDI